MRPNQAFGMMRSQTQGETGRAGR